MNQYNFNKNIFMKLATAYINGYNNLPMFPEKEYLDTIQSLTKGIGNGLILVTGEANIISYLNIHIIEGKNIISEEINNKHKIIVCETLEELFNYVYFLHH